MVIGPCTRDENWHYYVSSMLITFFGGLLILIPCRIVWYKIYGERKRKSLRTKCSIFGKMRAAAQRLLSGNGLLSKMLVLGTFLVNLAAVCLYLADASVYYSGDVICGKVKGEVKPMIWVAFQVYFLIIFFVRFVAAGDKLFMWIDPASIVDHFTIVPAMVSIYLDSDWFAFKYLRVLHLMQMADVLQLLGILKHKSSIRSVQVITFFSAVWLASSGFVHVSENAGDFFEDYSNSQDLPFWVGTYWLLVTMSTVGYGDISPSTNISKAFIVVFIMGSLAMFSSLIPEFIQYLGRPKYKKSYRRSYGKKHIVVCGEISFENVKHLLRNLEHEDALTEPMDVVFVSPVNPSLELEAFFRRRCSDVFFYNGTVMDLKVLRAVKLMDAEAVIIMTDKTATDPDEEDSRNIMRAAAVKNFNQDIRIIIQLLLHHNKTHLLHIPKWRWKPGERDADQVVCLSEFKMGIMAQNCLAPGITTLLSNLFTNRSFKKSKKHTDWTESYKLGAGNEIYVETLSPAFAGMTFKQAAELCFTQLEILLIAIDNKESSASSRLKINPGNGFIIKDGAVGFFFAQGPEEAQRVCTYRDCGNKIQNKVTEEVEDAELDQELLYVEDLDSNDKCGSQGLGLDSVDWGEGFREAFDSTGMVYWCPPRNLDDCIVDVESVRDLNLTNHIVIYFQWSSALTDIGLANLIMPLRSSCISVKNLKDIVLIIDPKLVREEWSTVHALPRIYVYQPSKSSRRDLRAVSVTKCAMCVILNSGYAGQKLENPRQVDRNAILMSLSIQTMFGQSLEERIRAVGALGDGFDPLHGPGGSGEIPMVTLLENDENIVFLDPDDSDEDLSKPLYLTIPYASGQAFPISSLDSLLSCTYLNGDVLTLVRALVTGTEIADYEIVLMEGLGITRRNTLADMSAARHRSHFAQLSLAYGPLEKLEHNYHYGTLFVTALRQLGMLCLGVYRLFDAESKHAANRKRFVITNPPYGFTLFSTDRIFVLRPFVEGRSRASSMDIIDSHRPRNGKTAQQDTPL